MQDKVLFSLIEKETARQSRVVNLIASENLASSEVLVATGSVLTNKYSEGYSGKRYYAGNKVIDEIETLAIERAKQVFKVPHANVQPYSGSPANQAVYFTLLEPGDPFMGLLLSHGGHLTHGAQVSFSGKIYNSVGYGVSSDTETIDFENLEKLALEYKPKLIWGGGTAYPRIWDWRRFREIADKVGAWLAADISHISGLIVAGVHPDPNPYADILMTTTHKSLRGPRGAILMVTERGLNRDPDLGKKIDKSVFPGLQGGPHNNVTAGIAVCLYEAMQPDFKAYGAQVVKNAQAFSYGLIENGLRLVSGGTDNHLVLVDLGADGPTGKEIQELLEENDIIVNRNTVPNETRSPFVTSGIRMGAYAMTTRGWKEKEFTDAAKKIADLISSSKDIEKQLLTS